MMRQDDALVGHVPAVDVTLVIYSIYTVGVDFIKQEAS